MNENIILSIACVLGAFLAYCLRTKKYRKALEQAKFPTTTGKIIKSEIQVQTKTSRNDDGTVEEDILYIPSVKYSYTVEDKNYEESRIEVLDTQKFSSQSSAEEYIAAYSEGTSVNVYYNPLDPKKSFLDNTIKTKKIDLRTWVLIVILLAAAIYILVG